MLENLKVFETCFIYSDDVLDAQFKFHDVP